MSCDGCRRCTTCPLIVCDNGGPIENTCKHGFAICPECSPGYCAECAIEDSEKGTDHDAPHAA